MLDMSFYKGKKVLITGHTGFKGTWMCKMLTMAGADVTGYALKPPTDPSLFELSHVANQIHSIEGDVRDLAHMKQVFAQVQPEIVLHLAAQPIVRLSYQEPVCTYETNVMGTVYIMECVRTSPCVKSFVNVTTDKVYLNREWEWGYRENDELNGFDPYSNSKSCAELVTGCYKNSFFADENVAISTVRAGNVIGGGDFAPDRIIPDCLRAARQGEDIIVRNPHSTRPYEHVLEPITVYLMLAKAQYEEKKYAGSYNVGPDEQDCLTTGELATLFCDTWNQATGGTIKWIDKSDGGPHEANFLQLDCTRLKKTFGWSPRWHVDTAMQKIVEWSEVYFQGGDIAACMEKQIQEFLGQ